MKMLMGWNAKIDQKIQNLTTAVNMRRQESKWQYRNKHSESQHKKANTHKYTMNNRAVAMNTT